MNQHEFDGKGWFFLGEVKPYERFGSKKTIKIIIWRDWVGFEKRDQKGVWRGRVARVKWTSFEYGRYESMKIMTKINWRWWLFKSGIVRGKNEEEIDD